MLLSIILAVVMGTIWFRWWEAGRQHSREVWRLGDEWRSVDRGSRLATSDWGGAVINGLETWSPVVRLESFERGVLVRVSQWIGRGCIWIPADEVRLSVTERDGWLGGRVERHVLSGRDHRIVLSPALADPQVLAAIRRAKFI